MTSPALEILLILVLRLAYPASDPCQEIVSLTTVSTHEALDPNSSRLNPTVLAVARGTYGDKTVEIAFNDNDVIYAYFWDQKRWRALHLAAYEHNIFDRAKTEVPIGNPAYCESGLKFYTRPRP